MALALEAQADAGSFIVDGARQRWVIDLGTEDYDLPRYFDHDSDTQSGPRWRFYRTARDLGLLKPSRRRSENFTPPFLGQLIICLFTPLDRQADRLADFEECFSTIWLPKFGSKLARIIYCFQTLRSVLIAAGLSIVFTSRDWIRHYLGL
jgi:hypothetical protein